LIEALVIRDEEQNVGAIRMRWGVGGVDGKEAPDEKEEKTGEAERRDGRRVHDPRT
jgi:hypothetical protein